MTDITTVCPRHTNHVTTIFTTHHASPKHCPCCPTPHIQTRATDHPDYLCYTYMGLNRNLAIRLLQRLNDINITRTPNHHLTINDLMEKAGLSLMEYPPTAYTPLTVICQDCHSSYRVLRGQVVTISIPPKHCIWCGSTSIQVSQSTIEAACWEALSIKYQLPIPILVKVYNQWQQHGYFQHFDDFMNAPANADQL